MSNVDETLSNEQLEKDLTRSAKLLSTLLQHSRVPNLPPIPVYKRHPDLDLMIASQDQRTALYKRFNALCEEYYYRFGRTHKYQQFDVNFEIGLYYLDARSETSI